MVAPSCGSDVLHARDAGLTELLRSDAWVVGDDETALEHRVALNASGLGVDSEGGRPLVGIACSASELNPCNLPLRDLVPALQDGVRSAGGVPIVFPVMSLGEDLMKPTAMLYRNLLSIEIEETLRSYPLDGVVLLANCDKTIPGAVMGAASADLPTLVVTCGPRPPARFRGRRIGTGTDLWRLWDERRAGLLDDAAWAEVESALSCGLGACNTMGTASTMAILAEILGFILPGTGTIPTGEERALAGASSAGARIVEMVRTGFKPSTVCGEASLRNAVRVLNAIGGSTNAAIHLAAIAGRLGLSFELAEIERLGRDVPLLVDVEPSGDGLVQDFDAAGGVPALVGALRGVLEESSLLADGRRLGELMDMAPPPSGVVRPASDPLSVGGAFRVVKGSLAPDGALVKISAASPELLRHRGRAVVFDSYDEMRRRVEDPALEVDPTSVLVLRGCGPVGAPGMPEWGMIPLPAKLLSEGVRDMVRVTDARMSGTSFGTVFLHVAPEAAIGGPLALVHDGDLLEVDAEAGTIELLVERDELDRRRSAWSAPESEHLRGWPALYRAHVTQAPKGCDLDFLESPSPEHRRFVEPVVGRS
ncbi:MAG: dihydroxyacid dehydratase [Acidimicrobiaceae bacterium]|nr:dihydroxyacid dehydratase [Acidimicrobiaceae bacterium]